MKRLLLAMGLATAGLGLAVVTPALAAPVLPTDPGLYNQRAVATFQPGVTDGLHAVSGNVTFTEVGSGPISAAVNVHGLQPNTSYVTVPYFDGGCLPVPGVTAFPSSGFTTDATGNAVASVSVNPKAINPTGSLYVRDIHSVSVRQLIVAPIQLPGLPIGTPGVPNVGAVEACDHAPAVSNTP